MGRLFGQSAVEATLPDFDIEMTRPQMVQALDYVNEKVTRKGHHLSLIVTGPAMSTLQLKTTKHSPSISVVPASPISSPVMGCFAKAVKKAAKKFHLGVNWINMRERDNLAKLGVLPDLVHRSLIQNIVVYQSEGLILLAEDYTFALKWRLRELSYHFANTCAITPPQLDDTVCILRQLVISYRGRPLHKGFIRQQYPMLEVTDAALLQLNAAYEWRFCARGITGVNDDWLEWRREGRVDMDSGVEKWDLSMFAGMENHNDNRPLDTTNSQDLLSSPWAINYDAGTADSSRACSPNPNSYSPSPNIFQKERGVEKFLEVFNSPHGDLGSWDIET